MNYLWHEKEGPGFCDRGREILNSIPSYVAFVMVRHMGKCERCRLMIDLTASGLKTPSTG